MENTTIVLLAAIWVQLLIITGILRGISKKLDG
jgi:hypothetical protein